MSTHGLAVLGVGPTAANTPLQVGATLLMPAGGPWIIHSIWSQIIHDVPTAAEGISGSLLFRSVAGDIQPDPAPGIYPLVGPGGTVGAHMETVDVPLNLFRTNWTAAGKAQIRFDINLDVAVTVAPQVAAGVIFGDAEPESRPLTFVDQIDVAFAGGAEGAIGNITISEKATRIVGILGILSKVTAVTASEGMIGTFRLASNDIQMPPAAFPFNNAISGGLGTIVGQMGPKPISFIPVDIPVIGGSVISCFVTTQTAITANVNARVYLAYE